MQMKRSVLSEKQIEGWNDRRIEGVVGRVVGGVKLKWERKERRKEKTRINYSTKSLLVTLKKSRKEHRVQHVGRKVSVKVSVIKPDSRGLHSLLRFVLRV